MKTEENFYHDKYGYCYYIIENNKALIFNLYVEKEYRHQGYGKKILQRVIGEIKSVGYKDDIYIEVLPREDSIEYEKLLSFYESLNLKIINKTT